MAGSSLRGAMGVHIPSNVYAQHVMGDGTLGGGSVVGNQSITFNSDSYKEIF
ncbi:MAG: hypothetical protein U5K54_09505 [Cytophagales bacterium]|nr:hypothetical protein [Cytophagales bacterium]